MYAVIKTGGKQYRVTTGDTIAVEKLDAEEGSTITLDEVLMLHDGKAAKVGTPLLSGAGVTAEVVSQTRGPKIIVFKKKRRKNYRRTKGHKQDLTLLKITDIGGVKQTKAKAKPAESAAEAPAPEAAADAVA